VRRVRLKMEEEMKKKTLSIVLLVLLFVIFACDSGESDYEKAKQVNTIQAYEEFVNKHPDSRFVDAAKRNIDSLRYDILVSQGNLEAYEEFVHKYPDSRFVDLAKENIDSLRYVIVVSKDSIQPYEEFIDKYPDSKFYSQVVERLEQLHFKIAEAKNTIRSYKAFLETYPKSKYTSQASLKLKDLRQQTTQSKEKPAWPPLPPDYLPGHVLEVAQLGGFKTGDSFVHIEKGGFRVLKIDAPLKDGVLGVEDYTLSIKDVDGKNLKVNVEELYTHDRGEGKVSLVWHNITVQPDGGTAMDLIGTYEAGKLVGYKFNVDALGSLKPENKIAIFDQNGWRVVTVDAPLKDGVLGVIETIKDLRLLDSKDGKAGLVWNTRERK
ncbi:MAG: hypothetical protein ACE5IR_26825, partial [bacterium]